MRPVHWVGSTRNDVRSLPEDVRQEVGFTLWVAQQGERAMNVVPMVGFGGANVLEVVVDDDGDTYRDIYTVRFAKAVYVLHVFKKKEKRGIATPHADLVLIRQRLKAADMHYRAKYETEKVARKGRSHEHGQR
jgi:phage-related protein